MKITLNDLLEKNACTEGILNFKQLKLNKINFSEIKEIYVKKGELVYLTWLCEEFKLSLKIKNKYEIYIYKNGLKTRHEDSYRDWQEWKYNKSGLKTRYEDSYGYWEKWEYNDSDLKTRYEDKYGNWQEWEYNDKGLMIRQENKYGYWQECVYNDKGLQTKYEDSNGNWQEWIYNDKGELENIITSEEYEEVGVEIR